MLTIEVQIELVALVTGSALVTAALMLDLVGFRRSSAATAIASRHLFGGTRPELPSITTITSRKSRA